MDELVQRTVEGVVDRVTGPMSFRFLFQPFVAILLGIRDGRLDAKANAHPYISTVLFEPGNRAKAVGKTLQTLTTPMLVGTGLDAIAQYLIFHRVLVVPAILVGVCVMALPYSFARGISNRVISGRRGQEPTPPEEAQT